MTAAEIETFINEFHDPAYWGMMDRHALHIILTALDATRLIPGDVVELGCHEGSTSFFLQRFLERYMPQKRLHVYDSFEGLPDRLAEDGPEPGRFVQGACAGTLTQFLANYAMCGQDTLPEIHVGWFSEIEAYPIPISFGFFDSDRYQSILDSFAQVWPRLSPGGIVVVHDLDLVGCGSRKACETFGEPWVEDYGCAILTKRAVAKRSQA